MVHPDGYEYVSAQSAGLLPDVMLAKVLKYHMIIADNVPCFTLERELQEGWRSTPVRAKRSIIINADTNAVFVHALGKGPLHHITNDVIADLKLPFLDSMSSKILG